MGFVVDLVIGVREWGALELIGGINAEIDEEVIDGEATFFGDGANFGEASILVPAAALVEIGKGKENREEEEDLEARETEHKRGVVKAMRVGMTKMKSALLLREFLGRNNGQVSELI